MSSNLLSQPSTGDRRLMLFDLALGGHHGTYIQYLLQYWYDHDGQGSLYLVVSPKFQHLHLDVMHTLEKYAHPNVHLMPISSSEADALADRTTGKSRAIRNIQEWAVFRKYAINLQATHALIMYLDTCELPLTLGLRSPCPFSGIYFRPTFHYRQFANYVPTQKDSIRHFREKFTLGRILTHPQFSTLYCLDPVATEAIQPLATQARVTYLPDPVHLQTPTPAALQILRSRLAIERDRTVFLLLGALDARKGIYQLLEAIEGLPEDLCRKLCLIVVGGTNAEEQANVQRLATALWQAQPIQWIADYRFVSEAEVSAYIHTADVVLAPYQKHVGMSGILLLAAAAGKPVLSSDYGLMGELVHRNGLGIAVDSTSPTALAAALSDFLSEPSHDWGDRAQMQEFAAQHSAERFAETLFQSL
jgi:glycosyltransferase involved in cell wall biosynthesis